MLDERAAALGAELEQLLLSREQRLVAQQDEGEGRKWAQATAERTLQAELDSLQPQLAAASSDVHSDGEDSDGLSSATEGGGSRLTSGREHQRREVVLRVAERSRQRALLKYAVAGAPSTDRTREGRVVKDA